MFLGFMRFLFTYFREVLKHRCYGVFKELFPGFEAKLIYVYYRVYFLKQFSGHNYSLIS